MSPSLLRFARLGLCLGVLVLAGCGAQRADVSGKVTHKNRPVVTGNVTLVASDGSAFDGTINPDGTYTVHGVPLGPVKIGVTSADPSVTGASAGRVGSRDSGAGGKVKREKDKEPAPKVAGWFPIPEAVTDPNKSGLTGTVVPNQPLDIVIP